MGIILISLLIHSLTRIAPGSEIFGVPASDTREIIEPDFNKLITFNKFFFSLNLWLEINLDWIPYFLNKIWEILVSSHKI